MFGVSGRTGGEIFSVWLFAWGGGVKSECKYTTKYNHSKYVDKISSQQVIFVLIFAAQTLKHETMETISIIVLSTALASMIVLEIVQSIVIRKLKKKLRASNELEEKLVEQICDWKDTHKKDVDRWLDALASNNEFVIKAKSLESLNKTLRTEIAELKDQRRVQALGHASRLSDHDDHTKVVSDAKAYYRFLIGKA